jgi:hypothetical protein
MSLVGRRKCLPKNFNPLTGPLLLPRDDDVLVGQAVLPRELNSVSGPVHVEDKGGGPVERLVEAGHIMVGSEKRELQALQVQRDAHDLVAASLHHGRNLDVVAPPELVAEPPRQVKAQGLLPLLRVFQQFDNAQPIDKVLVDDRAVDGEIARDAEDGQRPQHPALDIMAGQQEQQARPGIGRAALLNGLEERCADRVDGRQQTVVALAQGVRCQRRERQHLLVAGLQPGRAADFHLLLGQNLQDAMADEVLAGDLGVAGAGRRHVAAVMLAGQAGIVQVHHHGLLMIAVRRPAAVPGRLAGAADTRQAFPSLGFTHSSRGIHAIRPTCIRRATNAVRMPTPSPRLDHTCDMQPSNFDPADSRENPRSTNRMLERRSARAVGRPICHCCASTMNC